MAYTVQEAPRRRAARARAHVCKRRKTAYSPRGAWGVVWNVDCPFQHPVDATSPAGCLSPCASCANAAQSRTGASASRRPASVFARRSPPPARATLFPYEATRSRAHLLCGRSGVCCNDCRLPHEGIAPVAPHLVQIRLERADSGADRPSRRTFGRHFVSAQWSRFAIMEHFDPNGRATTGTSKKWTNIHGEPLGNLVWNIDLPPGTAGATLLPTCVVASTGHRPSFVCVRHSPPSLGTFDTTSISVFTFARHLSHNMKF